MVLGALTQKVTREQRQEGREGLSQVGEFQWLQHVCYEGHTPQSLTPRQPRGTTFSGCEGKEFPAEEQLREKGQWGGATRVP